tara:strand:- start:1265 stop:3841 length:2577 start_codon:yes stop_codon:yes gene_type:complete
MSTHKINADIDVAGEVQGTSLDINGNADISGTLTSVTYQGDVIASAYLDADTMHLSGTQTVSGAKTFSNVGNTFSGHLYYTAHDAAGNHYPHFKDGSNNSGTIIQWRQYYGSSFKAHLWQSDASGNMLFTFQGGITAVGALTGTSLDINGNADISGNLTLSGTYPRILLTDSNSNDDYSIINDNGTFIVYNDTDSSTAFAIAGNNNATFSGDLTVSGGDITLGGTGRIQGIDTVSADTDAANKTYVDNAVSSAGGGDVTLSGSQAFTGAKTFGAATQFNNTVTVGADTSGHDVKFFGNATGEYMQWDESTSKLNIRHDHEDSGLTIFTVSSASNTQPQLQVGRDNGQYWGVYTDDRNAHMVHRQDETSGTMTTRFDQWDSNTSDTNGEWLWRFGNGTGGSMATALTLTQAGVLTGTTFVGALTGNVTGNTSGSSGSCTGLAATATALATSRNFRTNLASTSTAGFTGAAACNPGVTGTLPASNGGTGLTSISTLLNSNVTSVSGASGSCEGNAATATKISSITNSNIVQLAASQTLTNKTIAASQVTEISNITASEGAQLENIGSTTISATQWGYLGAATGAITNTDTNTQLSTEAVQDIVGAMLVGTETRIGVSYDDTNGRINFVVDDMTANTNTQLSNAEVRAATAAATDSQVFTDADHTKLNGIATNATADQTNVSGSSGSCTGNAATATKISSITNSNIVQLSTTTTQTGTKTFSGVVDITNTTDSTNATGDTGALRTEGGASIAKKLYVGSTITGSADVIAFSDRKLKENIETLDGKKVLDMRGVSFTRKDTGAESSGVIAQEIQKVAPELVHDTEGTLGVAYGNLVGYLIEAVKDQQKQIDELKKLCNGCSR